MGVSMGRVRQTWHNEDAKLDIVWYNIVNKLYYAVHIVNVLH